MPGALLILFHSAGRPLSSVPKKVLFEKRSRYTQSFSDKPASDRAALISVTVLSSDVQRGSPFIRLIWLAALESDMRLV
jgi:hypothetical protein